MNFDTHTHTHMVPSLIFAIEGSTSNKVEKCGKKYATRHKPTFFCSSQVKEKTNMADPGEAQIKSKQFSFVFINIDRASNYSEQAIEYQVKKLYVFRTTFIFGENILFL